MKDSLAYLPLSKQEDLHFLVNEIKNNLPQAQMIILYGSYARNEYVDHDEKIEFGVKTTYKSDYDILVITDRITERKVDRMLEKVESLYYKNPEIQTPVQFIHENIKKFNTSLSEGRYFYTQIKEEGILVYNSEKYELAQPRELHFDEIAQQAQEYFETRFEKAKFFWDDAITNFEKERFQMSSFYLHQVCENSLQAIRLTFTLTNPKLHNLDKMLSYVRKYSEDLYKIFPNQTEEEKRLFKLLKSAYIEARYNSGFEVTKDDIEKLLPQVQLLMELTEKLCKEKIQEYLEKSM